MTPTRIFVILIVLVLVLYGISLAMLGTSGSSTNPAQSPFTRWKESFERSQRMDPSRDLQSAHLKDNRIVVSRLQPRVQVLINPSERKIRRLELRLLGPDPFQIEYQPSPLDREAMPISVREHKPGASPFKLVLMEGGGKLVLTRRSSTGDALFELR